MTFARRLATALLLIAATLYLVRAVESRSKLPLKAEHRAHFAEEFRAERESDTDWAAYLELEDRIAVETREAIGERESGAEFFDRYGTGSLSNPNHYAVNWNRSYALRASAPSGAAVLLHGLSDSPYSVRATAEVMQGQGISAYAPRMPGHGFAVGDLRYARWQDWMAVVRIAMRAADAERRAGQPLILVGYSNGGLLAIRYALDCKTRSDTPCPDGIVLMSPAIEVTPFARLARWHHAVSWSDYFEQFQWDTILPEIDPYKFSSFPKNPGGEIFRAAQALEIDMATGASRLPPILAFQSTVDDTVSVAGVIRLFRQLPANGSELVLYDVNRNNESAGLMVKPPIDLMRAIEAELPLPFAVTAVTNKSADSWEVHAVHYDGSDREPVRRDLGLAWPETVFSLSHIALPFRPDDPVYGANHVPGVLNLGGVAPKGERKVLSLSPGYFARLRHNPFFPYQRERISRWLEQWNQSESARQD